LGATPVELDLLDAGAVRRAVLASEPEAIVHQATALANVKFSRNMDKVAARTSELRDRHTARLRPRAAGPGRARRRMGAAGRRRSPGPHRRAHSARRSRRLGRRPHGGGAAPGTGLLVRRLDLDERAGRQPIQPLLPWARESVPSKVPAVTPPTPVAASARRSTVNDPCAPAKRPVE